MRHPFRWHLWHAVAVQHGACGDTEDAYPFTDVLYRCTRPGCIAARSRRIDGAWRLERFTDTRDTPPPQLCAVPAVRSSQS